MKIYNCYTAHELRSFIGTDRYYKHSLGKGKFVFTDGIHWLRDTLECHWLIDNIVIYSMEFIERIYCRLQIVYENEIDFYVKNATHLLQFTSRANLSEPKLYKLEYGQKNLIDCEEIGDFFKFLSCPEKEKADIENEITLFQASREPFDRITVEFKTAKKGEGTLILYDRYDSVLKEVFFSYSDLFIDEKSFNPDNYYKKFRLPLVFSGEYFVLMVPTED